MLGLWHLGSVTAACLAEAGREVIGVDPDPLLVAALAEGRPPISEPGLTELIARNAARLRFSTDPSTLIGVRLAWVAFDTPVDENDDADVEWVLGRSAQMLARLPREALVIVSSQLPVGSVARLRSRCADVRGEDDLRFACVPENLRLGSALESFRAPARIVAGVHSEEDRQELAELLAPFCGQILWTGIESAEMTKHALNGFLATSIAFANEIAVICEAVGADAAEVLRGLKSEPRIGGRAYLDPGDAFAGGTLARDLGFLRALAVSHGLPAHVSAGAAAGNAEHRGWTRRKLLALLSGEQGGFERALNGAVVAVWGLAYKPGTDTLRRSSAVELCRWLARAGAQVRAYDPSVRVLPVSLEGVFELCATPLEAVAGAQALVVGASCPEFRDVPVEDLLASLARPLIIDPAGWLVEALGTREGVRYARVGTLVRDAWVTPAASVAEVVR